MDWKEGFWTHEQSMFLVFLELKIVGSWKRAPDTNLCDTGDFIVSTGTDSQIHLIAPDGLRKHLSFQKDTKVTIQQNIVVYDPNQVEEVAVDEKEQAGRGKTRPTLTES